MAKTLLPIKIKDARLVSWKKTIPKSIFKLNKNSQAGIVFNKKNIPIMFMFSTNALLDILSEIDEKLVDRFSSKEYASKSINPTGWLIDEIESKLSLKPAFIKSLQKAIEEAELQGWIPFSKIKTEVNKFKL